jgi:DHA3 family macrolide efflux protein-like MFS transporter
MLIGGIALGMVLGLLFGGRLENLASIRLRFLPLLFLAVIVRFGTEALLGYGVGIADTLRLPLLGLSYGLLLFALWHNRWYPGLALAFVGIALNALALLVNGGRMPVWDVAFQASGLPGPLSSVLHTGLSGPIGTDFLAHLGPIGDIIPIPFDPVRNVASIGDVFLTAGLAFFLFATLLRTPAQAQRAIDEAKTGRYLGVSGTARLPGEPEIDEDEAAILGGTGLSPSMDEAIALERPLMMGGAGMGLASPGVASFPSGETAGAIEGVGTRPGRLERLRAHPYVRLALNSSFSALWVGQLISLFGDRVNQIALAAFVYEVTDSPLAVALTFFAGMVPNLILSPIAGTFVDRWDQKQVMVVSDILRAAAVLLLPVAVLTNVWLAYPVVFVITTISIFFRPARAAVLPRIVPEEDLMAANSAMWVGETFADVINYPIAGLFVVFLRGALPLAFWFDAVTYLASATLIATIVVPPLARRVGSRLSAGGEESLERETRPTVVEDLKAGWAFLRRETVLLANTVQGTAGQFSLGVITVASLILAKEITQAPGDAYRGTYAFMETAIGLGSLIGGFVLGAVAGRVRKGRLIIAAYTAFGIGTILLGIAGNVTIVLVILFGLGIANMAFVIPSQTLFQERTPPELMGRVVSFRFALVFGGMSLAMAAGGVFISFLGPGPVIVAAGAISLAAGIGGLFVKAVRDA